ncbi:MAG: ABC transporter ATP-binding protein [Pseudomonadota bacterium]
MTLSMIDVTVEYKLKGQSVKALDNVSLNIEAGEFLAVVGPSGSGKSTLLQVFGGMLSPAQGDTFINGTSLYDLSADERAELRRLCLGFVFQTFNLIPYLTAQQNVQVPMMLNNDPLAAQMDRSAMLLEKVGLADRMLHKPAELSSGQQQRVALARTLANDPHIIFADEPTGALDPETGMQVMNFLKDLNREGRTIVMVTHDPKAAAMASRCIRLVDGSIAPLAQIPAQSPGSFAVTDRMHAPEVPAL